MPVRSVLRGALVVGAVSGWALAAAAPAAAAGCEDWNNGSEIRCLVQGEAADQDAIVVLHTSP